MILGDGGLRHVETVRALVEAGASADLADRAGITPLQHARSRGYQALVTILVARAAGRWGGNPAWLRPRLSAGRTSRAGSRPTRPSSTAGGPLQS
ncbi:MAG TPA: hypothetical protein VHM00_18475 [Caldimonas sp.]|nr:hypothetical protein [Caldimonas sp.]HEX2543054.1 hypothetical protein [Caldimonas sp.]